MKTVGWWRPAGSGERFRYAGIDAAGSWREGVCTAPDAAAARTRLSAHGWLITSLTPDLTGERRQLRRLRLPQQETALTAFARQMAALLRGGVPLREALVLLGEEAPDPVAARVYRYLAREVEAGRPLSQALTGCPRIFDPVWLHLIRAGEAGGFLDEALARVARYRERRQELRAKARTAASYPLLVGLLALVVMVGIQWLILPLFAGLYADLLPGEELPLLTRLVLGLGAVLGRALPVLVLGIVLGAVLLPLAWRRRDGLLRRVIYRLPVVSGISRDLSLARLAATLEALLGSGVDVLTALTMTRATLGDPRYRALVRRAHEAVASGAPLSEVLGRDARVPPVFRGLFRAGEQVGDIEPQLAYLSNHYEAEAERALTRWLARLEPMLIVVLAVTVGFLAVALFLPLVGLIQGLAAVG